MKSIISNNKYCFICGINQGLHKHHIIHGSANRKKSDEDGLWIYLCGKHHNLSNEGVHNNKNLDLSLKKMAEKRWLEFYGKSEEDFIKRYGKTYI